MDGGARTRPSQRGWKREEVAGEGSGEAEPRTAALDGELADNAPASGPAHRLSALLEGDEEARARAGRGLGIDSRQPRG